MQKILGTGPQTFPVGSLLDANNPVGLRGSVIATMEAFDTEFATSKTVNGWQKLPSGLILQWGDFVVTAGASGVGGAGWVTYPIQFPTKALVVVLQQKHVDNVLCSYSTSASTTDAGRFSWTFLSAVSGLTRGCSYIAIGY